MFIATKDDFQTPFLSLKKAGPFIMMLMALQDFFSAPLSRVAQESQAMCSVQEDRNTNTHKIFFNLLK